MRTTCERCTKAPATLITSWKNLGTLANGSVNPLAAAQDVIRRAARYRLGYFPGKPENHDRLRELAEAPPLQVTEHKKMPSYVMPDYFFVTTATAQIATP